MTRAGMESTGVYWKPVYYLLEDQLEVWLINAEHLHNVPGRKTDVADSAWIAQMVEHGLVRPSFVPPPPIRELRDLTRHRRTLVEERTRVIQRLEKVLQDAGIKLTSVASALLTKSGRAMLEALLAGQDDPDALAELARGRLRAQDPRPARGPGRPVPRRPSRPAGRPDAGAHRLPRRRHRRARHQPGAGGGTVSGRAQAGAAPSPVSPSGPRSCCSPSAGRT